MGLIESQVHLAHVGNSLGVLQSIGKLREQQCHFLGAFDVVGIVLHAQTFFVVDCGVGLDADVNVLERRVDLVDVVGVVGDD